MIPAPRPRPLVAPVAKLGTRPIPTEAAILYAPLIAERGRSILVQGLLVARNVRLRLVTARNAPTPLPQAWWWLRVARKGTSYRETHVLDVLLPSLSVSNAATPTLVKTATLASTLSVESASTLQSVPAVKPTAMLATLRVPAIYAILATSPVQGLLWSPALERPATLHILLTPTTTASVPQPPTSLRVRASPVPTPDATTAQSTRV